MRFDWLTAVSAAIVGLAAVFVYGVVQGVRHGDRYAEARDREMPFYNDLPLAEQRRAADLYRKHRCRDCHVIWGVRNVMQMPPAPSLDGIGSIRSEAWLYRYLSAENPQEIVPSRLKREYRHPSYASIPEEERRLLARYFAHMKARAWYLPRLIEEERRKLFGAGSGG